MSEVVHGGIATEKKLGPLYLWFYHWFTREGQMVYRFYELKEMNNHRYVPAVVVVSDDRPNPVRVVDAPHRPNGLWTLEDGRKIKTSEIEDFDTFRILAGYNGN